MADGAVVTGLHEVLGRLASASMKMRRVIARRMVIAGARVFAVRARRNAPRRTGTLRRAIFGHYSPKRSRRDVLMVGLVRVRSGKKEANRKTKGGKRLASRDAFYAGWVEFGHQIVPRAGKARQSIGARRRDARTGGKRVPPHPFLAPAYHSEGAKALAEMERVARSGLEESARR